MTRRIVDVTLDNLSTSPPEPLASLFWELAEDDPPPDPVFHKEEWFSSTLLEWGPCGKLLLDGPAIGFAQYAPPSLFPRLGRFRTGRVSADAVYLAYCFVTAPFRGCAGGTDLVTAVASELAARGVRALEAVGDRRWTSGWLLPAGFLAANGFAVLRPHRRYPLMRRELAPDRSRAARTSAEAAAGA